MKIVNSLLLSLFASLTLCSLPINSKPQNFELNKENISLKKENKASDTINISSKEDLINFINESKIDSYSEGKTFNLLNDIDLEDQMISPVAIFNGTFNGNGFTIKNFVIDTSKSGRELGFVRKLSKSGVINDLNLDYSLETNVEDTIIGGVVGTNYGTINSCSFKGKVKGIHFVGGIAGTNEEGALITNSKNYGNIIGKIFCGGVVGSNKGTIQKTENFGIINNTRFSSTDELTLSNIGGIAGINKNTIKECLNSGEIGMKQVGNFIGGIAGASTGQTLMCSNEGSVTGNIYIGGIVGHYAEFITKENDDSYNTLIDLIEQIIKSLENGQNPGKPDEPIEPLLVTSSIKSCHNKGLISGDNSVGGICGYASNDNIKTSKDKIFDVETCFNEGEIVAAKQSAGGICGTHNIGNIVDSFNTGIINSNSADYVGGIVGSSTGNISSCFTISEIKGNKYVGGIGGQNKKMHDCYTISNIESKGAFSGALSGYISEINENIYSNYYVNKDNYAIDNIDYQGKAERVSRENLASKGTLSVGLDSKYWVVDSKVETFPMIKSIVESNKLVLMNKFLFDKLTETTKFGSYVIFLNSDGSINKKIFVPYGEDLNELDIPKIPDKDGNFAKWEEFDPKNITHNIYVKVIYDEIIRSIANTKGPTPDVLVEGEFYKTTYVSLTKSDTVPNKLAKKYSFVSNYKVDLIDPVNEINFETVRIKIRLPKDIEKPSIVRFKDGEIKPLITKVEGNYIIFDTVSLDEFTLLDQKFVNWSNPYFITTVVASILGGAGLITGITFLTIRLVRHSKKKKETKISE